MSVYMLTVFRAKEIQFYGSTHESMSVEVEEKDNYITF